MAGPSLAEAAAAQDAVAATGLVKDGGEGWSEFSHDPVSPPAGRVPLPAAVTVV